MPPSAWSLLLGPLLTGAALGVLVPALRWIRRGGNGLRRTVGYDDYGLLRVVALTSTAATADAIRQRLEAAGIRSTVAIGPAGEIRVLVFADELDQARKAAQRGSNDPI